MYNEKKRFLVYFFYLSSILFMFIGCASQPIVWDKIGDLDLSKGANVSVKAACEVPQSDLDFLKVDIQKKVDTILKGNPETTNSYLLEVTITKYDKGNAFARLMLIGLGQMYLYGNVEIKNGSPPVIIRSGSFKKNYCVGGLVGGLATMQKDMLPKVGLAIADAINNNHSEKE